MILDRHWWRTADGKRLVPDAHPDAAFLAYTRGQELPDDLARRLGLLAAMEQAGVEPGAKRAPKPRNKQAGRAADKSAED